jgi:hypothetical protein
VFLIEVSRFPQLAVEIYVKAVYRSRDSDVFFITSMSTLSSLPAHRRLLLWSMEIEWTEFWFHLLLVEAEFLSVF